MPDTIDKTVKERVKNFVGKILCDYYEMKKIHPNLTIITHYQIIVDILHRFTLGWEKALTGELSYDVNDINQEEILQGFTEEERLIGSLVFQRIENQIGCINVKKIRIENSSWANKFAHYVIQPIADSLSLISFWFSDSKLLSVAFKLLRTTEFQDKYRNLDT